MADPLRLGVIGAGRVFERLYLPALALTTRVRLAVLADTEPSRRDQALPWHVGRVSTMDEVVGGGADAVAVLTPPRLHAVQVRRALDAGMPVLVEKPAAMSTVELREWGEARPDVTPAFSRRWWAPYMALRGSAGVLEELGLVSDPAAWGAVDRQAMLASQDLLPHLADLARALTGTEVEAVAATSMDGAEVATLNMVGRGQLRCVVGQGGGYREWLRVGGRRRTVGPPGRAESLLGRVRRKPPRDVAAVAALLDGWAARAANLPVARDAWASVAIVEAYSRSLAAGGVPVAPEPAPVGW